MRGEGFPSGPFNAAPTFFKSYPRTNCSNQIVVHLLYCFILEAHCLGAALLALVRNRHAAQFIASMAC
jgi:hypothetical protein